MQRSHGVLLAVHSNLYASEILFINLLTLNFLQKTGALAVIQLSLALCAQLFIYLFISSWTLLYLYTIERKISAI